MKQLTILFVSIIILITTAQKAYTMSYKEAFEDISSKPMLLYITAPWVDDYAVYNKAYAEAEKNLSSMYNVAKLDITTSEFKLFNESFHLYPKLPYILLFKNNMKISRYLQKDCIENYACIDTKARSFLH